MHSACSRYVLAFNGEIYNHLQLRAELAAAGHETGVAWGIPIRKPLLAGIALGVGADPATLCGHVCHRPVGPYTATR